MKTIGVLIHSLTVEYALNVLEGITNFFKNKNIRILIAQTKSPNCGSGIYEYQCWASAEYLFSQEIDAFIVISGSYSSEITNRALSKYLEKIGNRPVISIGLELNLPNTYIIKTDCKEAYRKVIHHLINKHKAKKIAFMSANTTLSTEALERYEAYISGLQANGLEFDEKLVLNGSFTKESAIKLIQENYKTKADVPFDAILCANDLMATGTELALQDLGFFIPDEMKIFGFDETTHAINAKPKLSTIDQKIFLQGVEAAALAEKILNGQNCPRETIIPVEILYRQTCGCISLNEQENVHLDDKDLLRFYPENKKNRLCSCSKSPDFLCAIDDIYKLTDIPTGVMQETFYSLINILKIAAFDCMAVCLFDKTESVQKDEDIIIPEKMRLSMVLWPSNNPDSIDENSTYEPGICFNPKQTLFPSSTLKNTSGIFMIQPIFSGESTYGYILCRLTSANFAIYSIFSKIIVTAIAQSYDFTKTLTENTKLQKENDQLISHNTILDKKAKTDELTKILNRRGFMNQGQKSINLSLENECNGLVFFADMDGLKKINDTYGHETGDRAIQEMANSLKKGFRANDIVGRLSGDEFAVVAPGMNLENAEKLCSKILKKCTERAQKSGFKFKLSCSFGYVEYSSESKDLKQLLSKADELLYKEKKQKKEAENMKKNTDLSSDE